MNQLHVLTKLLCPNEYNSQFTNEYYLENILLVDMFISCTFYMCLS